MVMLRGLPSDCAFLRASHSEREWDSMSATDRMERLKRQQASKITPEQLWEEMRNP